VSTQAAPPEPFEHVPRRDRSFEPIFRPDVGGPLELLASANHPLVRATMTSTRAWRRRLTSFNAGAALLVGAVAVTVESVDPSVAAVVVGLFISAWPLVMLLGGALRAASRVVAERTEGTALQLVLTPLEKRPIAAAMVLPHAGPFLWGILATLPLYVWAGGGQTRFGFMPPPWIFWPFRFGAIPYLQLEFTTVGVICGAVMCLTDLALVWAAVHWGAAYAVRLASLAPLAFYLVWRLVFTALVFAFFYGGFSVLVGGASLAFTTVDAPLLYLLVSLVCAFVAWAVWWKFLLPRTVRLTLEEFGHFDRLADEEFEVKPVRFFSWFRDYGERP
jgi:hypothetical protein